MLNSLARDRNRAGRLDATPLTRDKSRAFKLATRARDDKSSSRAMLLSLRVKILERHENHEKSAHARTLSLYFIKWRL
jgi:hypothetical protein